MKKLIFIICAITTILPVHPAPINDRNISDTQKLGMALDYLTANKYHEALILLVQLDKKYKLNYRFKAYIGICHYYEWEYEEACRYLDEAIPHLDAYAPDERCLYYSVAAESHFELKEYAEAIPYFEKKFIVCNNAQKGETLYRIGFCYMFQEKWANAADYFKSALAYFIRFPQNATNGKISQLKNMIKGCEENQKNHTE